MSVNFTEVACRMMLVYEGLPAREQAMFRQSQHWPSFLASVEKGIANVEAEEQAQAQALVDAMAKAMGLFEAKPMPETPEGRLALLQGANGRLASLPGLASNKGKLSARDLQTAAAIVAGTLPATMSNAEFDIECKRAFGRQCSPLMPLALGMPKATLRQYSSRNVGKAPAKGKGK